MYYRRSSVIKEKFKYILILVVLFSAILGEVIPLFKLPYFNITITVYRLMIPLIAVGLVYYQYKNKINYKDNKLLRKALVFLCAWILYAMASLFISPYVDMTKGIQSIMYLILGLMLIFIITTLCTDVSDIRVVMNVIKYLASGLIIFALVEVFTGFHLGTSHLIALEGSQPFALGYGQENLTGKLYAATTIYHNVNDFSSMIVIFFPLLIYKNKNNLNTIIFTMLTMFILYINDANICIIAVLLAAMVHIYLCNKSKYNRGYMENLFTMISGIIIVPMITIISRMYQKMVHALLKENILDISETLNDNDLNTELKDVIESVEVVPQILLDVIPEEAVNEVLDTHHNLITRVHVQIQNLLEGGGSLSIRINMYIDSIAAASEIFFLGSGPGSYSNFIIKFQPDSRITDPHNWWLEILVQYGAFIFMGYVYLHLQVFKNLYKHMLNSDVASTLIKTQLIFIIACIAPSSYIAYSSQWIFLGLSIAVIGINQDYTKEEKYK